MTAPIRTVQLILIAAVVLAACCASAVALSGKEPRRIGDNGVAPRLYVLPIERGSTVCGRGQQIPAGTNSVTIGVGTDGKPLSGLRMTVGGRRYSYDPGRQARVSQGDVTFYGHSFASPEVSDVCVHNRGPTVKLAGGGHPWRHRLPLPSWCS